MAKNKYAKVMQQMLDERQRLAQICEHKMTTDAAIIALHREFGFGEDRARRFIIALRKARTELAQMALAENKDEKQTKKADAESLSYTKNEMDKTLREAIPDYPSWEERYKIDLREKLPWEENNE